MMETVKAMSIENLKVLLRAYKKAVIREQTPEDDYYGPVTASEAEEAIIAAFTDLHKYIENIQREAAHPCTTCKYETSLVNDDPCLSCFASSNWEEKPENEYTYSITSEYEWEPGVPISLVADEELGKILDQIKVIKEINNLAELLRLSAAYAEIIKRKQQGHDPCEPF